MSVTENKHFCVDLSQAFARPVSSAKLRSELLSNARIKTFCKSEALTESDMEQSLRAVSAGVLPSHFTTKQRDQVKLILDLLRMWPNGQVLRVRFLEGSAYLRGKVEQYARAWEQHANIRFDFIGTGEAEIRVSFKEGLGSWSYVGNDALLVPDQNEATMNFGWFDESTPEMEFSRTVIHEFGHALGCQHEHQSPAGNIQWNKPVVYAEYQRDQGWGSDEVDRNVFQKFTSGTVTNSAFDPLSIMLYPIPAHHTLNGFQVGLNNVLSPLDISFIARNYPKPL